MSSRLLRRRAATAVGVYGSVALGVLGTLIAARVLGRGDFGLYAVAIVVAAFFQVLLDLTVEEALVKFGFRYSEGGRFGRLRRLYRRALDLKLAGALLAAVAVCAVAPFADSIFGADGLVGPVLVSAALPLVYVPEGIAGAALVVAGRYDIRGWMLFVSQGFRLAGVAVGVQYGVAEAVLGLVLGQVLGSLAVSGVALRAFRRFPAAEHERLGDDRRDVVRFVVQSSLGTGVVSLRGALAPLLLGVVSAPLYVGDFRVAHAPQSGLAALTSPVRLILLTEQTRDWERGSPEAVFTSLRRYTLGALVLMAVLAPPLIVFMPELIRFAYGSEYGPASDAARLMLAAGAIQLVIGWSKSLPVSIGRPAWRLATHGVESLVLVPLVLVFGSMWDATGAALAVLVATAVFALHWSVLIARLRRLPLPPRPAEPVPS